jgi:cell division protein FtsX
MSWAWTFRHVHRQVSGHPRIVVATAAAFCLLSLVVGVARLGTGVVNRWGAFIGQNVHVIAYLGEDVDQDAAVGLAEILARSTSVARVRVVEPEQALARLGAMALSLASDARPLEGLEPDYFPRSLEISLAPAADLSQGAHDLAKRLRAVPGVLEVDAMTGGLARLAVWVKLARVIGIGVLVAFALVALLALVTVFLRSRATVAERAAVLDQLGETPAAIRLPSGLWTALAALAGGGVGALVLTVAWPLALGRLEQSLGVVSTQPLPGLPAAEIAVGLALTVLGGLAMGYFATPLPAHATDHA